MTEKLFNAHNITLSSFWQRANMQKFQYGQWDCLIFVGYWVEFVTGKNPAEDYIGKYDDLKGALSVIKEFGMSLDDVLSSILIPIDLKDMSFGDIALIDNQVDGFGNCAGIVQNLNCIALTERGLDTRGFNLITKAYTFKKTRIQ